MVHVHSIDILHINFCLGVVSVPSSSIKVSDLIIVEKVSSFVVFVLLKETEMKNWIISFCAQPAGRCHIVCFDYEKLYSALSLFTQGPVVQS